MPLASEDKITDADKKTIAEITDGISAVLGSNLRSIILRGSVACGRALDGISDLDLVIFPYDFSENQRGQIEGLSVSLSPGLKNRFSLIDLSYVDAGELRYVEKNARMILSLKLTGIVIFGEDIISDIEPMKISQQTARRIAGQALRETKDNVDLLAAGTREFPYMGVNRGTGFFCVWMMRVLCRGLIAPVMAREPVFTLNVEAAGAEYIRLFPEHAPYVERLLEWEKRPTQDAHEIILLVNEFAPLYREACLTSGLELSI